MEYKKLSDLCEINAGGTPSRTKEEYWKNGNIPWLKIGNLNSKYIKNYDEAITESGLKNSSAKLFTKGTILYTIFATIGEVGILTIDASTNQAIAGIKLKDNYLIENEYLYYYLLSLKNKMKNESRGVAQNNINLTILRNIDVPIREKTEQLKIINILSKIENLIEVKKQQIDKQNELIKSQFIEIFGNIKNNENFDYITIGEVINKNITKLKKKFKIGEEIKYIDISSIDNIKNIMTGYTKYLVGEEPSRAQQCLKYNDIVVSTVRPNLKNVAMNKYTYENIIGTSGFCVLRCKKCRVEYLMYILLSDDFTNDMCSITTGANYPAIHNEDIYNYKIPNAPIELQDKFAQIVRQIDKQKSGFEKNLKKLEELQATLMQEYFG